MAAKRPHFSPKMASTLFEAHYWYKAELAAICRQHGLPASGTKAELQKRVRAFLRGEKIPKNERARYLHLRRTSQSGKPLAPNTRLLPEGFRFNQTARKFFANYFGVPKFSFTKEMAAALRTAERRGDLQITVADLIAIYEKHLQEKSVSQKKRRRVRMNAEERTAQWNIFVRDFSRDPRTRGLQPRMQIAALLWRKVRDRAGSKAYSPRLLQEFAREIKACARPSAR